MKNKKLLGIIIRVVIILAAIGIYLLITKGSG